MLTAAAAMEASDPRECPLCGGTGRTRFRLSTYEIQICAWCDTEFNASFTGGGSDGELFGRDYFEVRHREAFSTQFTDYRHDPSLPVFVRRLEQIEERIGVGRVLDIGPGLGTFLGVARDRGWRAEGVELSAFAADFIRTQHGVPVFTGDVTTFAGAVGRTFDLVTFWDSLEHVTRPVNALEAAVRLLRPGGMVVIATDNFDCLVGDLAVMLYALSRGRVRYPVERVFIDRNRTYFTDRGLAALVERLGAGVVYSEKMEYPLQKIRTNVIERAALGAIYTLAAVVRRQAQITLFAVKR
jgi:SAM-dependent methyltransferase